MVKTKKKINNDNENNLDPRIIIWAWAAIEADFWRFYHIDLLSEGFECRLTWRRFLIFLRGLPNNSAFHAFCENKDKRKWIEIDDEAINKEIKRLK